MCAHSANFASDIFHPFQSLTLIKIGHRATYGTYIRLIWNENNLIVRQPYSSITTVQILPCSRPIRDGPNDNDDQLGKLTLLNWISIESNGQMPTALWPKSMTCFQLDSSSHSAVTAPLQFTLDWCWSGAALFFNVRILIMQITTLMGNRLQYYSFLIVISSRRMRFIYAYNK